MATDVEYMALRGEADRRIWKLRKKSESEARYTVERKDAPSIYRAANGEPDGYGYTFDEITRIIADLD